MPRIVKHVRFSQAIAPVSSRAYADAFSPSPFWNMAVSEHFTRARAIFNDDGSIDYSAPGHAPMTIPSSNILSCCWVDEPAGDAKVSGNGGTQLPSKPPAVSAEPTGGGATAPKVTVKGKF